MPTRPDVLETPTAAPVDIFVDTRDARIVEEDEADDTSSRDGRDIHLPYHIENVSHIAIDIGGSLAKIVYFTGSVAPAAPHTTLSPPLSATPSVHSSVLSSPTGSRMPSPQPESLSSSGVLVSSRTGLEDDNEARSCPGQHRSRSASMDLSLLRRRSLPAPLPGGRLNFIKFETERIDDCVLFLNQLIERSAQVHNIPLQQMRCGVRLVATGGGAHKFEQLFYERLGVEVCKADEMACLITGLNFITLIPNEVYWYSDELVSALHAPHPSHGLGDLLAPETPLQPAAAEEPLPRPSANPPLYKPVFDSHPSPKLPCLLVNIGSGVSIIKVDDHGKFERVSGTSLGGGTLWGLLSLLTDAEDFDEMLALSEMGDNANVDMMVGDIYGNVGYNAFGLKSTTIASSFGKVFRKETDPPTTSSSKGSEAEVSTAVAERRRKRFAQQDICRSLLYAISNNIGQIAYVLHSGPGAVSMMMTNTDPDGIARRYMNAEKYKLDRIYFGGYFIRAHMSTISTLSYAIRFWSQGTKRALFLRHEGYLGAVGAWIAKPDRPASPARATATAGNRSDRHRQL